MSFLAPLFFAGLALLVVPWLVHRIRRPERETVRFSSLMFVPDIKREVIERRRVQHILLMLLRMALLAVLAFAFVRPFQEVFFAEEASPEDVKHHVIVLDASLSMGAEGVWEEAQKKAQAVLGEVKTGDQVGLIRFGQRARVDVALTEDATLVRDALEAADWTWEKGDYLVGLQAAADLLAGEQEVQRVVHFVSDFQETGLPTVETGWSLPGHITFHPVAIGNGDWANASVDALALRAVGDQTVQIRARVKNWQGTDALSVRLWLDGQVADAKTFAISAGHASLVRFDVPDRVLSGFVEVDNTDALTGDNRQYFTHQPAPKYQVLVLNARGTLHQLIQAVVPKSADLPWQVESVNTNDFGGALQGQPAVLVLGDVTANRVQSIRAYVQSGGRLFLALQKDANVSLLNALLQDSGIQVGEPVSETQRVPLAWVDLKHRIFHPFRGAKFNDFSSVRHNGFHRVKVDEGRVLARFEGDGVMMAEGQLGDGRVLVWAGGVEMNRSNLARSPRFVPLVHESLRYLAGEQMPPPSWVVGDVVAGSTLGKPGVQEISNGRQVAVNVDDAESDPRIVTPAEFEIRMCEAPVLYRNEDGKAASVVGGDLQQQEYGYWFLLVMFGALLLEHVYAAWLANHSQQEQT